MKGQDFFKTSKNKYQNEQLQISDMILSKVEI